MRSKLLKMGVLSGLIVTAFGVNRSIVVKDATDLKGPGILEAAAPQASLRQMVDETCGACHAQTHLRPPGNYDLSSGVKARSRGVVAQTRNVDPFDMVGGDPETSLVVQKPLEGSITPHGGIKLPASHPTIAALKAWVTAGAPAGDMDRPAPIALSYAEGGGGQHTIVYTRRRLKGRGFAALRTAGQEGNLFKLTFTPGVAVNPATDPVNLTNLPATDDVQSPSVSLDGSKIAFARKQLGQNWQIWEINRDGSGLRQITSGAGNKIQPVYLPYKPTGEEARDGSGGIAFMSDASDFRDEYNTGLSMSLYVCDANGGNVRQIDFNPSHDVHPWLHSSGMLVFTRWQHNEHQGANFMSLFQISASDYLTAGTGLFGAFGEHPTTDGNSFHDVSEILDANYGKTDPDLFNPTYGKMIVRRSMRDDLGGSIGGPFIPRLQQTAGGANIGENTIAVGDFVDEMSPVDADDIVNMSSITYRNPRSLLDDLYVVSVATSLGIMPQLAFNGTTEYIMTVSSFSLHTFELAGSPGTMANRLPLLMEEGWNFDEATPLVVKPTPPKIGKPIDLTKNTGTFTSGDITDRNTNDGQPRNFTKDNVSVVRFIRALQRAQGRVDTGRDNDEGIATQVVGEASISSDGSFSADVPANTPLQFQVLDTSGRVLVNHKPWVSVAPGATERCVGCHSNHDKPITTPQTLEARQSPSQQIDTTRVVQFHFDRDIQPIFNAKCVQCHDSAKTSGAAGRRRGLSLVGRETPARTTESFESLIGGNYVRTQQSRASELMWWLTGTRLNQTALPAYPSPAAIVPHHEILNQAELDKIARWIDTGTNFRVVETDRVGRSLRSLNTTSFTDQVWPILEARCVSCHQSGGAGEMAMDLDGDPERAENQEDVDEERMTQVGYRVNFMIPEASILLRKPEPPTVGGVSHVGGIHWNRDDADYQTIYAWIAASNPSAAPAPAQTDLVNVNSYPNPFRDVATIVYGLSGAVSTKVEIKIYSQGGKLVRELPGTTNNNGATIGWNSVIWDGKDKHGNTIGNDVYFYVIDAEYGDGTKKRFRGKIVKVS